MFNKKLVIALVSFIAVMLTFGAYMLDEAANGKSTTTVLQVISTKLVKNNYTKAVKGIKNSSSSKSSKKNYFSRKKDI